MDLHTAYDVMDLPANTTLNALTERYYALTEIRGIDPQRLEQIQEAYNTIKAEIERRNPPPTKTTLEKVGSFLNTYKIQLIVTTILLIIGISIGYTVIKGVSEQREIAKHPLDIQIGFFGDFDEEENIKPIKNRLFDMFPEWNQIDLHVQYAPGGPETELDFEADQRAQTYLVQVKPDVFILDRHYFEAYNDGTVFAKLEDIDANNPHVLLDDEAQVIGVDVTDHPLFAGMDAETKEKFAVMTIGAKHDEQARRFLQKLLSTF